VPDRPVPDPSPPTFLARSGAFFFKWRNLVFPLVTLGLLVGFRPVPLGGSWSLDHWLDAAGLLLALTGQSIRCVVLGFAYIHRGGRRGRVYADELLTEGIFAHTRNPLYIANMLIVTGLFVIHNHPWVYALGLPFYLFAYASIVAAEEPYLLEQFGQPYRDYCARVPRWLPRVQGLRHSFAGLRFDRLRVLYKEYASATTWILTALLIFAYQSWIRPPFPGREERLTLLGGLFLALIVGWASTRQSKLAWGRRERAAGRKPF
jgi:protein-S-isoprenylcysteine O-methyltransferase Ste14